MDTDTEPSVINHISITSLEQNVWMDVKSSIGMTLQRLHIEHLVEPTFFVLHQLITEIVDELHYNVFKQIVQTDLGLGEIDNEVELKMLFDHELTDHGDSNIAQFCQLNALLVTLSFHDSGDNIVTIRVPDLCRKPRFNHKMFKALGYEPQVRHSDDATEFYTIQLVKQHVHQHQAVPSAILSQQGEYNSLKEIFSQLSYGIICFSGIGSIQSVSSSMLTMVGLEENEISLELFAQAIPLHFYNDVIWGMVMQTPDSLFENYRIRINKPHGAGESVLFNVSGYRDDGGIVRTLWQKITLSGGNTNSLSEGDLLNEAKVHNITRNYVPQLVEKKAREVVRLGTNLLHNEECDIAVLFCDIVGFTEYVEKNEKEESIINILNSVLRRISLSVKKYGGFIDKFMGDCIMVLFRNPNNAVAAALEMQQHSRDINQLRARAELRQLPLRIGIHWGKVVIGNVGTAERLDWTAIGDVVNTASRIEKSCQPDHVLISEQMRKALQFTSETHFECDDAFYISIKGKKDKLAVCYAYLGNVNN